MKNRARSKSWLCFHPGGVDESVASNYKPRSVSPVYVKDGEDIIPKSKRKKSSRRALSRIVKTVFFDTSLKKKSKKVQQDPYHTLRNLSSSSRNEESDSKSSRNGSVSSCSSSTLTSESFSASSSSSNLSSLSDLRKSFRSNSFEAKTQPLFRSNSFEARPQSADSCTKNITATTTTGRRPTTTSRKEMPFPAVSAAFSSTNGLYLLFISLLVLVFWGRVFAIICTATWIYFVPFRQKSSEEEEDGKLATVTRIEPPGEEEKLVMRSREYKKRVIMEGLLERSHSRF